MSVTWRHPKLPMRFWQTVVLDSSGCWMWTGPTAGRESWPYGTFSGRPAHRVPYETFIGPVPQGLELDHLCRVRLCVNPDHMEPVTHQENVLRSYAALRSEGKPVAHGCAVAGWKQRAA
jgi:hypothetical protein